MANIDFALAPYVIKTFKRHLKKIYLYDCKDSEPNQEILEKIENVKSIIDKIEGLEYECEKAYEYTKKDTFQAAEGLIHNASNLESRSGAQQVFSSITYGMNTTPEGQLLIDALITAQLNGLGHHETAVFPIAIFIVHDGVNYKKGDPNYYLYRKAMYCSSKRLFPTFLMLDAPFNLQYYKEGDSNTIVQAMGLT